MSKNKRILTVLIVYIIAFSMLGVLDLSSNDVYAAANTYYVSTKGSDTAGTGTKTKPWKTIAYACSKVTENMGHTIRILEGTYIESNVIQVPPGVNLLGDGPTKTIIKSKIYGTINNEFKYYAMELKSQGKVVDGLLSGVDGNQTISGFMMDGQSKKVNGGIIIAFRSNVTVHNIEVKDCFSIGVFFSYTDEFEFYNSKLINNTFGADSGCTANLTVGTSKNGRIHDITVDDSMGVGYGINSGDIDWARPRYKNLKIYNCDIKVARYGAWANFSAGAITIEHWNTYSDNTEIYNNFINNTISLAAEPKYSFDGVTTTRVHHNKIIPLVYAIEVHSDNILIDRNHIEGGAFTLASWAGYERKNIRINHNVFYKATSNTIRFKTGCNELKVYNNTFYLKMGYAPAVSMFGGVSNNIDVKNNLMINVGRSKNTPLLYLEGTAKASGYVAKNNLLFNYIVGSVPAIEKDNMTVSAIEDLKLKMTGDFSFDYFAPKAGSPLIDAGIDVGLPYLGKSPDIGAVEYGEKLLPIGIITPTPKPTIKPTPTPKVIVNETFNSMALKSAPKGWTLIKTGGTATVEGVPSSSDKSMKLNKTKNTALSATKTFTAQSGIVNVEAKLRGDNVTSSKSYLYIMNSTGIALTRISIESSKMKIYDGKLVYSLLNVKAKSWYTVRVTIDTNKDICSIYVNDKLNKSNIKLITTTGNIGQVKYEIPGSYKGTVYLDNVKITKS